MRGIKRSVSRRDLIKALGVSGITLGSIGTGVTIATDNEDNDNGNNTKECPKDLDIVYVRKDGEWKHHVLNDTGNDNNESEPDGLRIKGDKKKVKIYAHFPFAVSYATREKKRDRKRDEKSGRDWHDKFKHCKKRKPVVAKSVDSVYRATIKADSKREKKKICWFRIYCPNSDGSNHDWKRDEKHDKKHDDWKRDEKHDKKHDDWKRDEKHDEKHDDWKRDEKHDEKHDDWKRDKKRDENGKDYDESRNKEDC